MKYNKEEVINPDIDTFYKEASGVKLPIQVYLPKGNTNNTPLDKKNIAVLCIHGGGWTDAIKDNSEWNGGWMRHQARYFVKCGFVGITISYRSLNLKGVDIRDLFEDCCDAVAYIKREFDFIDKERLLVMGDSAGGHLCTMLGICENNDVRPYVVIACNPVLNCTKTFSYASDNEAVRLWASPVLANITTAARFLFIHGDKDSVADISDSVKMNEKLLAAGFDSRLITLQNVTHAFILYGYKSKDEEIDSYMETICNYIDNLL